MTDKPRIFGVDLQGKWRYVATCPCGWQYGLSDQGWGFVVTIATAHTYMKSLRNNHKDE